MFKYRTGGFVCDRPLGQTRVGVTETDSTSSSLSRASLSFLWRSRARSHTCCHREHSCVRRGLPPATCTVGCCCCCCCCLPVEERVCVCVCETQREGVCMVIIRFFKPHVTMLIHCYPNPSAWRHDCACWTSGTNIFVLNHPTVY